MKHWHASPRADVDAKSRYVYNADRGHQVDFAATRSKCEWEIHLRLVVTTLHVTGRLIPMRADRRRASFERRSQPRARWDPRPVRHGASVARYYSESWWLRETTRGKICVPARFSRYRLLHSVCRDEHASEETAMLLTKRKAAQRRLVTGIKRARDRVPASNTTAALDHEKQLAVVDAVEWAVERWASRDFLARPVADPRAAHAARLIAALTYLDPRFERLDPAVVTGIIDSVATPGPDSPGRLDAKAAAALLAVEVGAFRR